MSKLTQGLAVAACLTATAAHADTVEFLGYSNGSESVTYTLIAPNTLVNGTANAGGFLTTLNGGPSFTSYCIDLYQTISFNTPYNNYTPVGGGHVFANATAYADLSRLYGIAGVVNTAPLEAAFQIAVWEIAYETTGAYSLGGGSASFGGSMAATSQATSWLAMLANAGPGPTVPAIDSRTHQDIIYAPVPEPSTVLLMLGGLAGVGALAKRRRDAAKKAAS